jgi:hypothetical protein
MIVQLQIPVSKRCNHVKHHTNHKMKLTSIRYCNVQLYRQPHILLECGHGCTFLQKFQFGERLGEVRIHLIHIKFLLGLKLN